MIVEVELTTSFTLDFDYSESAEVMRMVKEFDLSIEHQAYDDRAQLKVNVKLKNKEKFVEKITLLKALGLKLDAKESNL
jgi:putative IMPACT (imprinted ancient) family translation regulator